MIAWDGETDVVVLGSGGAGLTAALAAASQGAKVELYEQARTIGGTTAVSAGVVWVPAHGRTPELKLPVEDAMKWALKKYPRLAAGNGGGGPGGTNTNQNGGVSKIKKRSELKTTKEKTDFIDAHGIEAFTALDN